MKTLDEVIKNLGDGTEHLSAMLISRETWSDALHYLQEYKANQEDPDGDHQQLEKAQKLLWEFYQNDPLTWDELKQMEGRPVWVETLEATDSDFVQYRWGNGAWYIVKEFALGALDEYCHLTPNWRTWTKKLYGDTWQAYRKERK